MNKLAFVDLETTGCSGVNDRIIEIGILRVEDEKVVARYNKLVNPETYISPFITSITGITGEDIENAPTFYSIKDEVRELLNDSIFVAHNARFDYGFLKSEFRRVGITFNSKHLCTAKLSKRLFPEYRRHNLDSIIERFGFICERRHRAFDDAKVMWDFFQVIKKQFPEEILKKEIDKVMKRPSLPVSIPLSDIEALPECSGVYLFMDEHNMPLYIGKSINIKDRVLSHFSADYSSQKEMKISTQISHIETIKTTGELGALLLESSLIKKMQPLYNRKLRHASKLVVLKQLQNKDGYFTLTIETVDAIIPSEINSIMAVFRSQKQAKDFLSGLSEYYFLCPKFMGLEKTPGACFSSKLGTCKGACTGKENILKYNLRFIEAFTKTRIKKWPFEGPIVIKEKNENGEQGYMVDQWCFIAEVKEDQIEETSVSEIAFDYDTYKILERFIMDFKNRRKIINLPKYPVHSQFV